MTRSISSPVSLIGISFLFLFLSITHPSDLLAQNKYKASYIECMNIFTDEGKYRIGVTSGEEGNQHFGLDPNEQNNIYIQFSPTNDTHYTIKCVVNLIRNNTFEIKDDFGNSFYSHSVSFLSGVDQVELRLSHEREEYMKFEDEDFAYYHLYDVYVFEPKVIKYAKDLASRYKTTAKEITPNSHTDYYLKKNGEFMSDYNYYPSQRLKEAKDSFSSKHHWGECIDKKMSTVGGGKYIVEFWNLDSNRDTYEQVSIRKVDGTEGPRLKVDELFYNKPIIVDPVGFKCLLPQINLSAGEIGNFVLLNQDVFNILSDVYSSPRNNGAFTTSMTEQHWYSIYEWSLHNKDDDPFFILFLGPEKIRFVNR